MVGLIFIGDLTYCPYLDNYTKYLDEYGIEYEILYWERSLVDEPKSDNYIPFEFKSELNQPFYKKLKGFIKFRRWLKKRIAKKNYSKLILLSTLSGMIIPEILLMKYKNKYILDIRDYSYEWIVLFKKIESILIKNSNFTAISSRKFKDFLPKSNKYILNHNINLNVEAKEKFEKTSNNRLNFVWAGAIRYYNHQQKIINQLGNDNRFNLLYHGMGSDYEALKKYAEDKKIENIEFTGAYLNKDKEKLLKKADILNNSYDNEEPGMGTEYAVSNTYYDGIIFKIPQLVETESYKEALVEKYKIGVSLDINSNNLADDLFNYYQNIDLDIFNSSTDELYNKYVKEQKEYYSAIKKFINM